MKTISISFLNPTRQKSNFIVGIFSLVLMLSIFLVACTNTRQIPSTETTVTGKLSTQAVATFFTDMTANVPTSTPEPQRVMYSSNKSGNWNLYYSHLGIKDEVPLTSDLGDERNPVWSPDGTQIAYQSNQDGLWQIVVMDANGLNKRQLTSTGNNQHPSWSPDGSRIAFDTDRGGPSYMSYIYLMGSNGENQSPRPGLYYPREGEPAWSADGSNIAFIAENDPSYPGCGDECTESVYLMDTAEGHIIWGSEPGWYDSLAWSPDGRKLIFVHLYNEGSIVEEYDVFNETINTVEIGAFRKPEDTRLYMYHSYRSVNFSPDGKNYLICSMVTAFTMNTAGKEDGPPVYIENCFLKPLNNTTLVQTVQGTEYLDPNDGAYFSIDGAVLQP